MKGNIYKGDLSSGKRKDGEWLLMATNEKSCMLKLQVVKRSFFT